MRFGGESVRPMVEREESNDGEGYGGSHVRGRAMMERDKRRRENETANGKGEGKCLFFGMKPQERERKFRSAFLEYSQSNIAFIKE